MDNAALHFYPATGPIAPPSPLARYLPPLPPGMAAGWLADNVPPGSWLLDPLGASPELALEAARAGYRVLVASNNPILSFMLETLASAPRAADFQSALAELASAKRGDERLEAHIKSLYQTQCETCGESVQAQAFLWRKGEPQPFARLYECPNCGESGERPITPADVERLSAMGSDKLHRSRALQRVILDEDERREDVEAALDNYLARPLYVLFTLLNKIGGLGLPPQRARLLQALIISVFDAGSTLWPWPNVRSRPKQLIVPPQFRENNLWLALEDAVTEWSSAEEAERVPITRWPEPPPASGGIALFHGRVKALMPLPESVAPRAVITVFPRPNQAFWTLSVLWAGWLWGAEAALPLRNVIERRRYDWNWHTSAIHSALSAVGWSIPAQSPFFGLLPELAPGFLSAATVAAEAAGFQLEGLALRAEASSRGEPDIAQGLWKPAPGKPPAGSKERESPAPGPQELEITAHEAIRADLLDRYEPAPYLTEYAAGLAALMRVGAVPRSPSGVPGDLLTRIQAVLARTFADRSFLRLFGGPAEEERGMWWLNGHFNLPASGSLPLADRVEMEVVRFMQKQPVFTYPALERSLCETFGGLLTPPVELLRVMLDSYAEPLPGTPGSFRLRASESSAVRKADLRSMRDMLESAGRSLDFTAVDHGSQMVWEKEGQVEWRFYLMASSIISRFVLGGTHGPAGRCVIVLPGGRARLLAYKLRRDPRLSEGILGWHFLKFRHLREIAALPALSLETWAAQLDEDPLSDEASQMQLFPG